MEKTFQLGVYMHGHSVCSRQTTARELFQRLYQLNLAVCGGLVHDDPRPWADSASPLYRRFIRGDFNTISFYTRCMLQCRHCCWGYFKNRLSVQGSSPLHPRYYKTITCTVCCGGMSQMPPKLIGGPDFVNPRSSLIRHKRIKCSYGVSFQSE